MFNTLNSVFLRKMKRNRKSVFLACLGGLPLVIGVFLLIGHFRQIPPAWRSRSVEAGLLRVMQYIEREGDLDGVIRDAFVDKVWKGVKMDLFRELVYKSGIDSGGSLGENGTNSYYDFLEENMDVIKYALFNEEQSNDNNKGSGYGKSSYSSVDDYRFVVNLTDNSPVTREQLEKFLSHPVLNPFDLSYKLDQSNACLPPSRTDVIIIAVPSAPGNFERRQKIRKSEMAKFVRNSLNRAKLLFFTASPDPALGESSRKVQALVDDEQNRYGDIVQATYVDSYKNMTKKAAQLLHWSSKYCPNGKFLIRIDDDININITAIIKVMEHQYTKTKNFMIGTMRSNWKPHRKRKSKYFISFEETPHKIHPPFLLGGAMGYPIKIAGLLLEAMRRTPLIWLDDLFLTAFCAKRVGVPIFNSTAFLFQHE